ncbi:MAG: hypothetical protein ACRDKB_08685 [Actinomycetota bacterium]
MCSHQSLILFAARHFDAAVMSPPILYPSDTALNIRFGIEVHGHRDPLAVSM